MPCGVWMIPCANSKMKALRIFLVLIFLEPDRQDWQKNRQRTSSVRELPWTSSIAHDGNFFYWSHTVTLVKTDQQGQALIQVEVPSHHGDLTAVEDELYVAVELGMFNQPAGQSKPWIYLMIPTP